jgi:hypothetical protein
MKSRTRFAGIFFALALVAGCNSTSCASAQHPAVQGLQIEGKVAVYGSQLASAFSNALEATDKLVTAGVITKEQATPVVRGIRDASVQGQKLGDALKIVDESRDAAERASNLQKAGVIIKAIQTAVDQSVIPITNENTKNQVLGILKQVTDVLVTLALILPSVEPSAPPPQAAIRFQVFADAS